MMERRCVVVNRKVTVDVLQDLSYVLLPAKSCGLMLRNYAWHFAQGEQA